MCLRTALSALILLSTLPTASAGQYGDFTYTSDGSAITITGYTGSSGAVAIPPAISGLPVVSIKDDAFVGSLSLTTVNIPATMTNIELSAFGAFPNLVAINMESPNAFYSTLDGVLFNPNQTSLLLCPSGKSGAYTTPSSITNIEPGAFYYCWALTNVTILGSPTSIPDYAFEGCSFLQSVTMPNTVVSIGDWAFRSCYLPSVTLPEGLTNIGGSAFDGCALTSVIIPKSVIKLGGGVFAYNTVLTRVYFQGNAPMTGGWDFDCSDCMFYMEPTVLYYLPGTTGWSNTFDGRPALLWNPMIQSANSSFGVRSNRFGFTITGTAGIPITIAARTNAILGPWIDLQTRNLDRGSVYFADPAWTNVPARFYRIQAP